MIFLLGMVSRSYVWLIFIFIEKKIFRWVFCYIIVGIGFFFVLGIEKFKEVMGMSYKNLCYNCFVLGLFVVFVIDDIGFMSGEIMEVI